MIGKTVASLLLALIILSNSALATNWVYLQRQEGTRDGPCTEYLDTDSVVIDKDKVVYWTVWVLDKTLQYDGTKKILFKKEAPLVYPLRYRTLEQYRYNSEDVEIRRYIIPINFYAESPEEINRALQYAKTDNDIAAQPDHTVTPTPRWYGFVELKDCDLYWNINSIVAWPQDSPTTVEMLVKFVWNKDGLEQRKNYLQTKQPYRAGFDGLSYTLVNYQFLISESRMRILSEADHDAAKQRMTLLEGTGWRDIEKGSKDEWARKIALSWLKGGGETGGK